LYVMVNLFIPIVTDPKENYVIYST
jgi:hypothetical protein